MEEEGKGIVCTRDLCVNFGSAQALQNVSMDFAPNSITAVIGPSGCGKTTLLKSLNRMNEVEKSARTSGEVLLDGQNIYARGYDEVALRRRVGMVFQDFAPFSMSIYDNVCYAPKLYGVRSRAKLDEIVESALQQVGLWNDVKHRLRKSPETLPAGHRQRLCIARMLAAEPQVLLLDEPTSAQGPGAMAVVEELLMALKENHTILLATHDIHQAVRVSDECMLLIAGELVEVGPTERIFSMPVDKRTEAYVSGQLLLMPAR